LWREIGCRGEQPVGYAATSGFPSKQNLPDQFQFRVPAFEFAGIVYAGKLQQAREGLGAAADLAGPDGKACVAVEGHLPLRKWAWNCSRTLQLRRPRGGRPGISVPFNIVWKLVRGDGGPRHDCPIRDIEQLAADSPGGAADQSSRPTGNW
jgi:hypothetical protein